MWITANRKSRRHGLRMIETSGNLWEFDGIHVITTNGFVKRNGHAVMGRGCAKEAAERYAGLTKKLGRVLQANGNHVVYFPEFGLVTYPVKHNWWEQADLELIVNSAHELVSLADSEGMTQLFMPFPGCGNGRLQWADVKQVISPILDDRFTATTWRA